MEKKLTRILKVSALCGFFATIATPAQAVLVINLPGSSDYEGWSGLTTANNPGYGSFPGAAPWPAPIDPNEAGSAGGADFNKVSGNGFPAGSSIYSPFTQSVYVVGNTLSPSAFDIETLVFQIDMGPGEGGFFNALPTLSFNGGSQGLGADFSLATEGDFPFVNPIDPQQAGTTTLHAFQWDLSGLGNISTYSVEWQVQPHAQIYALQADTGSSFAQVIPEPSALALGGLVFTGWLVNRRRKKI